MRFLVFGKEGCDACSQVKDKINKYIIKNKLNVSLEFYDMETEEGLVEGALYNVSEIPTFIIEDERGSKKWEHGVLYKDIDEHLKGV